MTPARLRRLHADYTRVSEIFAAHPYIRVVAVEGNPPEKYTLQFDVPGLVPQSDDMQTLSETHRAEVFLPMDYPRRPPFCRMITPVFHPNIDPAKICIGDHWSAGESLAHLIIRIGQMLCYQDYNVQSPLNAKAAVWTQENVARLPLMKADLTAGL